MFDKLAWQRAYRRKTENSFTAQYERLTPKGFLVRAYRNMLSRVTGVQKSKAHLYINCEILPKEDFYTWALADNDFLVLWDTWQKAGRPRKLAPSIDRINPDGGYTLANMRWLTHSENSRQTRRWRLS